MLATLRQRKRVVWMGDSLKSLRGFPPSIRDATGYALYLAQIGQQHVSAKPLKALGAGVWEICADDDGGAFRAVYVVRFQSALYVLHVFQKKSKRGIATPKSELDLIRQRMKRAVELEASRESGHE